MSIPTEAKVWQYNGNSLTTLFDYGQPIQDASWLKLTKIKTDGTSEDITSNYTVQGVGSASSATWKVLYPNTGSPLATGEKLYITLEIPITQDTEIGQQEGYDPEEVEKSLDKLTLVALGLQEQIDRKIGVGIGQSDVSPEAYLQMLQDSVAAAQLAENNAETAETNAETAQTAAETARDNAQTYATNAQNSANAAAASAASSVVNNSICNFVLSPASGIPIPLISYSSVGTIYITPYQGNYTSLWDGSSWVAMNGTEASIVLTDNPSLYATNTVHDVFQYISSGAIAYETLAWTNATTRATDLAIYDGVYCKSGDKTRRYIGSFSCGVSLNGRTDYIFGGSNTPAKILMYSAYRKYTVNTKICDLTDSWTYSTASYRAANGTGNYHHIMLGLPTVVTARYSIVQVGNSGEVSIGVDSITTPHADVIDGYMYSAATLQTLTAYGNMLLSPGRHYIVPLEYANSGTATFWGDNGTNRPVSGMVVSYLG